MSSGQLKKAFSNSQDLFLFSGSNFSQTSIIVIQRIQTLLLFIAALINFGIFFTSLYRHAVNDPAAWIGTGFAVLLTAATVIALFSIFLHQNRTRQLFWVKLGTYVQIAVLGAGVGIFFSLGGFGIFLWKETISLALLIISLICYWQAGRFIKKDEELVQSMDRIR